ncbi:hypothetical protein IAD21_01156 [Abditibacteriota bacterium]|nr:hypothetical protein IAD21_01156 [Abditibacteriota bacterium]
MPTPRSFLISLSLIAIPSLAQTVHPPTAAAIPNAKMEARTARELNVIAPAIMNNFSNGSDGDKLTLALAFARLGRVDAGLRSADAMELQTPGIQNSGPFVRDAVCHIGARRCAIVGNVAGARKLALTIKNLPLRADALISVARAQVRSSDISGARKTLFQISPLIGENWRARIYIAVLFYRAKEPEASKRLLERVEKELPPLNGVKPPVQKMPQDNAGTEERRYLSWAFLQTGQAEKSARLLRFIGVYAIADLLHGLVRAGHADVALRLARENSDKQDRLSELMVVAWELARATPQSAVPLLEEINQRLHELPPESPHPNADFLSRREQDALVLAALRRRTGDKAGATTLLNELIARVGPASGAAAHARFSFALHSFLFENTSVGEPKRPVRLTRAQIEQITIEVNAALPSVAITRFAGVLPEFVDAQIEVGAVESARQTLTLMEKNTLSGANLRGKQKGNKPNILYLVLAIARRWRKLGDTKRATDLLNRVWNIPSISGVSPRDRAWNLIKSGFVDEGKRRLASVGTLSQEAFYISPSLAYSEARFTSSIFPTWLEALHDPQLKLIALNDFSLGLTASFFQSQGEQEFSLSVGESLFSGYAISY